MIAEIAAVVGLAKGAWDLIDSYSTDNTRPLYRMPQSAIDSLNTSKYLSSQKRLPGQSLMEDQLASNTAQGLKAIQRTSPNASSSLGALAQLYANRGKSVNQLNIAAAQNYTNNQKYLANAQNTFAGFEEKQAGWDVYAPYTEQMNTKAAFEKSGWTNILNSLNGLASYNETQKMWDAYLNSGKDKTTSTAIDPNLLSFKSTNKFTDNKQTPLVKEYKPNLPLAYLENNSNDLLNLYR